MIKVQVPASTANVGPGFDILGLALSLYNTIEVEKLSENRVVIEYSGEGKDIIPCNSENLIYKAILKVYEYANVHLHGIHIKIHNDIPLMGGLGSSSSAIVSGIVAGNYLLENKLSKHELLKLAVELDGHPDNVTPALFGGFTLSYKDHKDLPDLVQLKFPSNTDIIAVTPNYHVSTHDARKVMPKNYPLSVIIKNQTNLFRLIKGLEGNKLEDLKYLLEDEIHQPYRFPLVPGLKRACEMAYQEGAIGSFISGSGPTLIALTKDNKENIAQSIVEVFKNEKLEAQSRFLNVDFDGAKVIS